MCFMEGQGVDGHVGDDFLCCFMFIFFHDGLKWCRHNAIPVQCSECQSGSKQARTNDRRDHDSHNGSHFCSECQGGSKQARDNGRSNHDPLVCVVLCPVSSLTCTYTERCTSRWFFYATRGCDGQCDYMITAWKLVTNLMKGSSVESVAILAQASSCSNVRAIFLRHKLFWFCLVQVSTTQFRCFPLVLVARVDDASDSKRSEKCCYHSCGMLPTSRPFPTLWSFSHPGLPILNRSSVPFLPRWPHSQKWNRISALCTHVKD